MIEEEGKIKNGNSVKYIEHDLQQFWDERDNDPDLQLMKIQDYQDQNGLICDQTKLLIITCTKPPYKNKLIKIRIDFENDYPESPLKMSVQRSSNGVPFLHANVYHDCGVICHPLLQKKSKGTPKFTHVLKKIQQLIYSPNFNNAANLTLSRIKFQSQMEYLRQINENAQTLQDGQYEQDNDSSDTQ